MAKNELICLDSLQLTNDDLFVMVSCSDLSNNAELIVYDTHTAILVKDGQMMDTLQPGRYPIFNKEDKGKVRKVDVIYMSQTAKLRVLWGTKNRLHLRDAETGIMFELGANGEFEVQVSNPRKIYLELIGVDKSYDMDKLKARLQGRMMSSIETIIARVMDEKGLTYASLASHKTDLAAAVKVVLGEMFENEYGIKMHSFTVSTVFVPPEFMQKIERARALSQQPEAAKAAEQELVEETKAAAAPVASTEKVTMLAAEVDVITQPLPRIVVESQQPKQFCTKCGTKCDITGKFCMKCGNKLLPKRCVCGKGNDYDAKFCVKCGSRLT